jgi:pyridine nucleotide-disulfide oxidoreductase family protein
VTRLLLAGGGHSHVEVLRRFAAAPPAEVEMVLVSPSPRLLYSGMVPGVIAGHYTRRDAEIDLAPLAARAGARFVAAAVTALDPAARAATLDDGSVLAFDVASLDVGASAGSGLGGADAHAIAARPLEALLTAWARMREDAARGAVRAVAIVGGGIAAIEIACAVRHRFRADLGPGAPAVALVTDEATLGARQPDGVRRRLVRIVEAHAIAVHAGSAAESIDADGVRLAHGGRVAADRVVVATAALPAAWLCDGGLACDARGFVRIGATLRSVSHEAVFAAGDCAVQDDAPRPRAGVYAVRAGPPLAANLLRALAGQALRAHHPQRTALALIATGGRYAVASRPPWSAEGAWVWRWKDRIDRRFVAAYRADA